MLHTEFVLTLLAKGSTCTQRPDILLTPAISCKTYDISHNMQANLSQQGAQKPALQAVSLVGISCKLSQQQQA